MSFASLAASKHLPGAWMLTIRTTASPRFANVWRRPGGTSTKRVLGPATHLLALDAEGQLAFEDVERVVLGLVQVLGRAAGVAAGS